LNRTLSCTLLLALALAGDRAMADAIVRTQAMFASTIAEYSLERRPRTLLLQGPAMDPTPSGGFVARATWNVHGSVGHWGHVHQRGNRYQAELEIAPVDGFWKLTGLEILDEQRL
jgi:hypothetical protein